MLRINPNPKPLNHRRLKVVYLLCFFLPLMFGPIKANDTRQVNRPEHIEVEYRELPPELIHTMPVQFRFADPKARPHNTYKLVSTYSEFNKAAQAFNDEWQGYRTCWDIKPEHLLPKVQKMREQLEQAESLLLHLDEVDK